KARSRRAGRAKARRSPRRRRARATLAARLRRPSGAWPPRPPARCREGAAPRQPARRAADEEMHGAVALRRQPALGVRRRLPGGRRVGRAVGEPFALPGGERVVDALHERSVVALAEEQERARAHPCLPSRLMSCWIISFATEVTCELAW